MQTVAETILPDANGRFGEYGGRYVPETLMHPLQELEDEYFRAQNDPEFQNELQYYLREFCGRPTPLYHAERLTRDLGGAKIYLKREDLLHTGAHKINNAMGQILLAKRMGKTRIIAETGAGQHGVATATVAAMFGLECVIYMGSVDCKRQELNVFRMRMLGAEVVSVEAGQKTLKEAVNEAMRDWVTNVRSTHYILGTAYGAHPYPVMVRDFQTVIGREARAQLLEAEGRLPDYVLACVGGGSNSIGMFHPFVPDEDVRLIGLEAGGEGVATGKHSATLSAGRPGVLHGAMSYLLQDKDGQVQETHSISAGLDYPGVGPEHSYLKDSGRAEYREVNDSQALEAFHLLCRTEGIIPALESSHAVSAAVDLAKTLTPDQIVVVCLSGRGDKDIDIVAQASGLQI